MPTIDTVFSYLPSSDISQTIERQAAANIHYDGTYRHLQYNNGDLLWHWVPIKKPGLSQKLMCKYIGRYRFISRLSLETHWVDSVDPQPDRGCRSTESAHSSRLKPYFPSTSSLA